MSRICRRTFLRGAIAAGAALALPWPVAALPKAAPPITYEWFSEYSVGEYAWIRRLEVTLRDGRIFEAADLVAAEDVRDPNDPVTWERFDRCLWAAMEKLLEREGLAL